MSVILNDVLLLAGHTTRTSAYVQALAAHGLRAETVLLYGSPTAVSRSDGSAHACAELFLPDCTVPAEAACRNHGWPVEHLAQTGVNEEGVRRALQAHSPRLVVFSGYGGEIVGQALLGLGVPFLHVHAGWLPEYRGSTTVYYSLLREGHCAASAILLSPEIDCGTVVGRQTYPAPPAGMDVDHVYDPAIRADLLVRVLRGYAEQGTWNTQFAQEPAQGENYYVIHPVLKHLALLSLQNGDRA